MKPLEAWLRSRWDRDQVPAVEVMAKALYDSQEGYYRRAEGPWGRDGKDYYTALDLGPLLGATLALRLEKVWAGLGRPSTFTVLEPGAGRGWLGRDLLISARDGFRDALRYLHQDENPGARREAETALAPWLGRGQAAFVGEGEPVVPFLGAVVCNELLDALPTQPYRYGAAGWELQVLGPDGPDWVQASEDQALAWFGAQEGEPAPGDGLTFCPGLPGLLQGMVGSLQAGLFLAIDYGDSFDHLRAKGVGLRRFRGHRVDARWWEDLGEADLTADVDFTRVKHLLANLGTTNPAQVSLSRWVRTHAPLADWEVEWQELDTEVRLQRMENLLQLTLPSMMGERFQVLEATLEGPRAAWSPALPE